MKKIILIITYILGNMAINAQEVMTPELLWKLGRVSALGITQDKKSLIYKVSTPDIAENKSNSKFFIIPIEGGLPKEISEYKNLIHDKNISPNGQFLLYSESVKIDKVLGKDFYPNLEKSNVQIYDGLDYRHWDHWNDGTFNHVFYKENKENAIGTDLMKNEPFHSPQQTFGGDEDFI